METKKEPNDQFYASIINVRNTELTIYWTRYNILAVVNLALLAAVSAADESSLMHYSPWLISFGGIILALIWFLITIKGKQILENRWDKHIRAYESRLNDQDIKLFTEVHNEENNKSLIKRNYDNLNILSRLLPIICMCGWLILGIYFPIDTSGNQKTDKMNLAIKELTDNTNTQLREIQDLKIKLNGVQSQLSDLSNLIKQNEPNNDHKTQKSTIDQTSKKTK